MKQITAHIAAHEWTEVMAMTDKDKYVNIADLKVKVRYWCKTRGVTKVEQASLIGAIERTPYTVKADIKSTPETTENEIEMLRNQLKIAHAQITRLESKYEGVASEGGADS